MKKILISGASIAGPKLAYWLNQYSFNVTVAERAAELRLGGQNVDIKECALEIIKKMGLEDEIKIANTTETGIRFVSESNSIIGEFPKGSAFSITQYLEILRGDLVNILYRHTNDDIEYIFGDHITRLEDRAENVAVTFSSGDTKTFDLVIVAEGIGSSFTKI